jgi:SHS2 domain-containing protein
VIVMRRKIERLCQNWINKMCYAIISWHIIFSSMQEEHGYSIKGLMSAGKYS